MTDPLFLQLISSKSITNFSQNVGVAAIEFQNQCKKLSMWLFVCTILIFIMIILGGVTRLTGSGLSIVHWKPISGILPPLSYEHWQQLFQAYQQSPEYQKINYGMTLADFKGIFWLEFIHRLWGRLIGIVFLVPLILAGRHPFFRRTLFLKLAGILLLGGLQGIVGWYMVKSGLNLDPHVSHYRLVSHLFLGFTTYGLTFYYALMLYPFSKNFYQALRTRAVVWPLYWALWVFVLCAIFYGGLVAGLKAGLMYNTFPTMGGYWIPPEFLSLKPWWKNFFENHASIQACHRFFAVLTVVTSVIFAWRHHFQPLTIGILGAVILQIGLGITTLLLYVPVSFGSLHQGGALLIITLLIAFYVFARRVLSL